MNEPSSTEEGPWDAAAIERGPGESDEAYQHRQDVYARTGNYMPFLEPLELPQNYRANISGIKRRCPELPGESKDQHLRRAIRADENRLLARRWRQVQHQVAHRAGGQPVVHRRTGARTHRRAVRRAPAAASGSGSGSDPPGPKTLRQVLTEKGCRPARLALLVQVSRQTIYNLLSGKHEPRAPLARAIAETLGVEPRSLGWWA